MVALDNKHFVHIPVMVNEVLDFVQKSQPSNFLDCTFGLGGHSRKILEATKTKVTAIDCDPSTIPFAQDLNTQFGEKFSFLNKRFSKAIDDFIAFPQEKYDCVLADFGLSSLQIDDINKGFSYSKMAPLLMNMEGNDPSRCQYIVNQSSISELAKVIRDYGEERHFYEISKNIINNRPIQNTLHLRQIIENSLRGPNINKIKSLARVFQAIRIYTNQELDEIKYLLKNLEKVTTEKCSFIFIYFHSLEGKEVFNFFKNYKVGKKIIKEFLLPTSKEVAFNSRSRSARMLIITHKD